MSPTIGAASCARASWYCETVSVRAGVVAVEHQGKRHRLGRRCRRRRAVRFRASATGAPRKVRFSADEFFFQNAIRAGEVGIQVSAYFFSRALTEDEAREEGPGSALENLRETEAAGAAFIPSRLTATVKIRSADRANL
ncbi:MAG: hypothetical protein ACLTDR_10975 [Adlercreutzia equolifaciens]